MNRVCVIARDGGNALRWALPGPDRIDGDRPAGPSRRRSPALTLKPASAGLAGESGKVHLECKEPVSVAGGSRLIVREGKDVGYVEVRLPPVAGDTP